MPATFVLTQLPPLKARYYSISSSNDLTPGEMHLTVAVVNYKTKGNNGLLTPSHHKLLSILTVTDDREPVRVVADYVANVSNVTM